MNNYPRYKCHKVVNAFKIARISEGQKNAMILLSEAIGEDVRKIRARLDTLERD